MPRPAGRSRQPLQVLGAILRQPAPVMTIVLDEPIGRVGAFTASGVVGELRRRQLGPGLLNRRNDAPLGLHFIATRDRKSTRLNSSHLGISYAVFCLKKKTN